MQIATSQLLEPQSNIQTHHYLGLLIQARHQIHITVMTGAKMDNRL